MSPSHQLPGPIWDLQQGSLSPLAISQKICCYLRQSFNIFASPSWGFHKNPVTLMWSPTRFVVFCDSCYCVSFKSGSHGGRVARSCDSHVMHVTGHGSDASGSHGGRAAVAGPEPIRAQVPLLPAAPAGTHGHPGAVQHPVPAQDAPRLHLQQGCTPVRVDPKQTLGRNPRPKPYAEQICLVEGSNKFKSVRMGSIRFFCRKNRLVKHAFFLSCFYFKKKIKKGWAHTGRNADPYFSPRHMLIKF